mmetsp:Transcript_5386/g.12235  ORF Transcript_5386/g.12235 Transcript_5386/m.12235 type:complete len:638 (+) Transcript_5386:173-2086(+)
MQARLREIATTLSSELGVGGPTTNNNTPPASAAPAMDSLTHDIDLTEINPLDLFCSSSDTLRGKPIDQIVPPNSGWSARPTRISGVAGGSSADDANYREEIQLMCRRGIPPSLKCAAWIINVVAAANPDMSKSECDDFGTFRKVRVIDHGWDLTLKSLFPDESDLERADVLDFGVGHDHLMNILLHDHGGSPIPDKGIQSLTKVLHAARDSLGLEFCPLLPDITCLLLSYMPESYAYATVRQMVLDDSTYFLAISRVQHLSWCKTFADLMKRCFPQTAAVMEQIGALQPAALEPILKRFFVPLLKRKHVLRIMDIFTSEGAHAIFRIGTTLCCLAHAHLGDIVREHCDNAAVFWEGVRRFAHSKHFRFDIFLDHQAYGVQKSLRILTRPIFPRQDFVTRLISNNEAWAEENQSTLPIHEDKKPLGLVEGNFPIVLAKHSPERLCLAQWLPPALQSTKLDLIFSSSHHGRSLEMFYRCCSSARHTITIMEVLGTDTIIGMYATQTWHNKPDGYGDGECFLFRLNPKPECFRYKIGASHMASFDDGEENISRLADAGQLMISGAAFISMGVGEGGASGLRLNEDLTRGSTSKSIGFENEELIAEGVQVFEVGLVEVYRFIREVDNKPVDKVDPWRGLFD